MTDAHDPPAPIEPPAPTAPPAQSPGPQQGWPAPTGSPQAEPPLWSSQGGAPTGLPPGPGAEARPLNVLAVVSLVSAFVVSLAAIITGHIALAQLRQREREGHAERGRGIAIAGVVVGYAGLVGTVVGVAVLAALFFSDGGRLLNTFAAGQAPNLTFAAGQTLSEETTVAFTDDLATLDGWKQTQRDWGDGNSTYASDDGACTVSLARTALGSVQVVAGDDSATSDNLLAMIDDAGYDDVAMYASSGMIARSDVTSRSYVDARAMGWSTDDGTHGSTLARAFTALGYGLSIDVACTDEEALGRALDTVASTVAIATD